MSNDPSSNSGLVSGIDSELNAARAKYREDATSACASMAINSISRPKATSVVMLTTLMWGQATLGNR